MVDQISIGNFGKGLKLDKTAFNLDNDAFPFLFNFYIWRGRAKRKRGTQFVAQLQVQIVLVTPVVNNWQTLAITLSGGRTNLLTYLGLAPSPNAITNITQATQAVVTIVGHTFIPGQVVNIINVGGMTQLNGNYYTITTVAVNTITIDVDSTAFTAYTAGGLAFAVVNANITPGSIIFTVGGNTYTDPNKDGILVGNPAGSGTINYSTGEVTISGGGVGVVTGTFSYFPGLPVMGLEDFVVSPETSQFPVLLAFDTRNSYQINQNVSPPFFYRTSYYKGTNTPFTWSGDDFQQFWTTNYSHALWATNGKPGFNFVVGSSVAAAASTTITFTFTSAGNPYQNLIIGDKLWFNEWGGTSTINGILGTVSFLTNPTLGIYVVTFTNALIADGTGIAQLLTASIPGQDGIKWYDGDPTASTGLPTGTGLGWVNFAPPLTALTVSIDSTPSALYYLIGAIAIVPFKDRLLFFSPTISDSGNTRFFLQDTVLWSWNGTPYYTDPVPTAETSDPKAYYVDQSGLGGYLPAGISQPIKTIGNNEDALLVGFGGLGRKTRLVYTGDDFQPFLFFNINSQLPSSATFSSITLDKGSIDLGTYGICMTDQQSANRIDLDIPDEVFEIQTLNNGLDRISAIRNFQLEWMYFSYAPNTSQWKFPTQSFLYNYRDNTWAVFYENITTQGNYRAQNKFTWQTVPFPNWESWNEAWNAGISSALVPKVILGNPEGYVLIKDVGTAEGKSGTILAISNSDGITQITSVNHCVASANPTTGNEDYLQINGALGILTSTITGITLGTTTTITTTNTFAVGQFVTPRNIVGTNELNNHSYLILAATAASIVIQVDSTDFMPYVSGGTVEFSFNGLIGAVKEIIDADNFVIDLPFPPGTYIGGGYFIRLSQPFLITKQFNFYWQQGKKVRLCAQKYLLDATAQGQVTVNVYLSQDQDNSYNNDFVNPPNNSLIYSQIMYTAPESTNLGLTPANTNLQMIVNPQTGASGQQQIWHRFNTSLIGDSFQVGITLNDSQMRNIVYVINEIVLHGMHLTIQPSSLLA